MGRHKQPEIRERLLEACTDFALQRGLPDRLGPLAAAVGTSPRMLLYHFVTKDGLLREVLHRARARQRQEFGDLIALGDTRWINRGSHDLLGARPDMLLRGP